MLATSRVKRTRLPLAEMSMFSLTLAPLNRSVSVPAYAWNELGMTNREASALHLRARPALLNVWYLRD